MLDAFVDESGSPSPADGGRCFAVAVLVTASPRAIELHVRRARRGLHRQTASGELKAAQTEERVVRRLLLAIADETCEIYGVIVDKRYATDASAETLYQTAVAHVIASAVGRHPELHIVVDRRYTKSSQRLRLEKTIREAIAAIPDQVVIIEQADSTALPGLQAVDFVAWALRRHGEGFEEWTTILAKRIVALNFLKAK